MRVAATPQASIPELSGCVALSSPRVVLVEMGSGCQPLRTGVGCGQVWGSRAHFCLALGSPGGSPSQSHLSGRRRSLITGCSYTPCAQILKQPRVVPRLPAGRRLLAGQESSCAPGGWQAWRRLQTSLFVVR